MHTLGSYHIKMGCFSSMFYILMRMLAKQRHIVTLGAVYLR